jgi:hypothetical protein
MQTFLPYSCFHKSAQALDYRRLGKQRIECKQILNALLGRSKGWTNHPATLMWRGHEAWLIAYANAICSEWRRRGYKDQQLEWFMEEAKKISLNSISMAPSWLGNERFHSSHRAALLHKAPEHYEQFGWTEEPKLDYWWPVKKK